MADVKWLKFTVNMFDDEKIKLIQSMPEGDALLIIWVRLILLAGKCNTGGYIYFTDGMPYTEEMLATIFNKPVNIIRMALATLDKFGMIERDMKGIYLVNFEKHQNLEGLDKIREQTRNRVEKHRQQKQLNEGNVTVTQCNATDIDKEIDIDLDKDIYTKEFIEFWNSYPRKITKDKAFKAWKARLKEKELSTDMIKASKNYSEYCKKLNTETQFIKHPSTFIGSDKPYKDFINGYPEVKSQPKTLQNQYKTGKTIDLNQFYDNLQGG